MAYENEWETGSGFSLDGALGTVTEAAFLFRSDIGNDGATVLNLNIELMDEDGNVTEEVEQYFSVGGKFEANRDGTELVGNGKINKNSNYGILMESVKDVCAELGVNPGEALGNPRESASWEGTVWRWGTMEVETRNPTTGESGIRSKVIVTELADAEDEAPAKPAKAAAKKAPATRRKAAPKVPAGIEQDLWDTLLQTAIDFDGDHDEWAAEWIDDEQVADVPAAKKAIMSTKAGSVWAAAGKDA